VSLVSYNLQLTTYNLQLKTNLWSACDNERSEAAPLWYFAVKRQRGGDWAADGIGGRRH
jgi:hypothetical protein